MLARGQKQLLLIFLIIGTSILSVSFFSYQTKGLDPSEHTIEGTLYYTKQEDIRKTYSKIFYDSNGDYNIFLVMQFYNDSYNIYHIQDERVKILTASRNFRSISDIYEKEGYVYFIYNNYDYSYGNVFYLGEYNLLNGEFSSKHINNLSDQASKYKVKFFDEKVWLIFARGDYVNPSNTRVIMHEIYYNKTIHKQETTLPYPNWNLQDMTIINDTLVSSYKFYESTFPVEETFIIVSKEDYHYNASVLRPSLEYYNVFLSSKDDQLFLVVSHYNTLYSKFFSLNDSLIIDDFTSKVINFYNPESITFTFFDDITYGIAQTSEYYLLNDDHGYPSYNQQGEYTVNTFVISFTDEYINSDRINIKYSSQSFASLSFDMHIFNTTDYIFCYSTALLAKNIDDYKFIEKRVFALHLGSSLPIPLPKAPYLYNINSVNPFVYFWYKNWLWFVIPLGLLGLLYSIFFKKINAAFKKMKVYLLRPIVSGVSKTHLILINSWLFVSNSAIIIFTLWKTNKKKLFLNLLGLSILSLILLSSATLIDSEKRNVIHFYLNNANLGHDATLSAGYSRSYSSVGSNVVQLNTNYTQLAKEEINNYISQNAPFFHSTIENIYHSVNFHCIIGHESVTSISEFYSIVFYYTSLQLEFSDVFENFIIEGRKPTEQMEVLIHEQMANLLNVETNDTIKLALSNSNTVTHDLDTKNFTISGIYSLNRVKLVNTLSLHDLPSDHLLRLTGFSVLTFDEFFLKNVENITKMHTTMTGSLQFQYDFSTIDPNNFVLLYQQYSEIFFNGDQSFSFDSLGRWSLENEITFLFNIINSLLNIIQFLIYFISIPIVFLALFLINETNQLNATSIEQEMEILRSKGLSVGRLLFIYSSMSIAESFIATILGFTSALFLTPVLIKIDTFLTFNNPLVAIGLALVPVTLLISFFGLTIISLPRIAKLSKKGTEREKPPRKFWEFLKRFKLHYIVIIIMGLLFSFFSFTILTILGFLIYLINPALVMIFVFLIGIGGLIALFGIIILLKDLHKAVIQIISKIMWRIKKSFTTLSFVEINSDIRLFNNTFLTYIIVVSIIFPFIVTPLTIQQKYIDEAYFYNGSDLSINNWNEISSNFSKTDIMAIDGVSTVSNVSEVRVNYNHLPINMLILDDPSEFYQVVKKPPDHYYANWKEEIQALERNQTMLVSSQMDVSLIFEGEEFVFTRSYLGEQHESTFKIKGVFGYFPLFYDEGFVEQDTDEYTSEDKSFAAVMSFANFNQSADVFIVARKTSKLLIKTQPFANMGQVQRNIENLIGLNIQNANEMSRENLFGTIPFYFVIVAAFSLSIFICLIAIVYTSASNPIKLLQAKMVKHDILKKMGVPTKKIILLSAMELFFSCLLPGLALGGFLGYQLMRFFNFIFIDLTSYNAVLPYKIQVPIVLTIAIFVGIPIIYYSIFFLTMKMNFYKYRPRNLE